MKMSIEVKDNKFIYSYEIGKTTANGEAAFWEEDCEFFLRTAKYLREHVGGKRDVEKAASVIKEANEFMKALAIALGDYGTAAKIRQAIKAMERAGEIAPVNEQAQNV